MTPILIALASAVPRLPSLVIEQYALPNGLAVILQPDPSERLVAIDLRYAVGSLADPPDRKGLAHLVEHMMFERDPNGDDVFGALEPLGAVRVNAHTSFDRSEYVMTVPPEVLELALWLEAKRMQRLDFDATSLAREVDVVENEMMERRRDRPYGFVESLILEGIFPAPHPLHFGPLGSMDHLRKVTVDDVMSFHAQYYGPQDATLAIVGGFDVAGAKALIERHFGPIPAERPPRPYAPAPATLRARPINGPERIASRARLTFLWRAPAAKSEASPSLEVLTSMLRYRAALANFRESSIDDFSASLYDTPAGRLFRIDAAVTPGMSVQMAQGRVQSIIETYVWVKPQKEELEGTKKRLRLGLLRALASIELRAAMLQMARASYGDARVLMTLPARWEGVTAASIQKALNQYIVGQAQVAVAQPIRR
jgi:zinc protease